MPSQPDSHPATMPPKAVPIKVKRRGGGGRGAIGAELGGNRPERHRREQRRAVGDHQDDEGCAGNDPGRATVHRRGIGFHLVHCRGTHAPRLAGGEGVGGLPQACEWRLGRALRGLYPICDRPIPGAMFSPRLAFEAAQDRANMNISMSWTPPAPPSGTRIACTKGCSKNGAKAPWRRLRTLLDQGGEATGQRLVFLAACPGATAGPPPSARSPSAARSRRR